MFGLCRLLLAFGATSALLARAHAATSSWEYPSQEAGVHAMVYLGGGIFGLGLLLTLGLAVTACVFERRDGNRVGQLQADGEGYGSQRNHQQQQELQQGQGQYQHHYGVVQDVQGKGQDAWGGGTWAQPPPKAPPQAPLHGYGPTAVPPLQQLQPAATQVVDFNAASANPRMWG